ncbi:hypothetical protein [Teredinibacter franksiae]|uniref:hypothetical protein n=1 Tax=Teredinibacter franksiae TaxID=2761453 RepID=UPI00162A1EB5|nr:hypothetical protein [Teredinibacter franksiae]
MKIFAKFTLCALLFSGAAIADEKMMSDQDAQKTWDEYHERIKSRRLAEAKVINLELVKNDITSETDLVLDFSFFTQDEAGANGIKKQLSENYEMIISKKDEYWHINGTSRPYAVNLNAEQHLGWVEFMHDVALSYGCIFSTWSITEPKGKLVWSNESIETEFN